MSIKFSPSLNNIFDLFRSFIESHKEEDEQLEIGKISVPLVPKEILIELLTAIIDVFKGDQPFPNIVGDVIIIGDLHGHLFELASIINSFGYPPNHKYVFLGDYIDRGQFSLELLVFVFLLKYKFRRNVILIRGNHETIENPPGHDFTDILYKNKVGPDIVNLFSEAFNQMPIACIVNNDTFCAHGGIGPGVSISTLRTLSFPVNQQDSNMVADILWSDPNPCQNEDFEPNPRGRGVLFNGNAFEKFLNENGFTRMIRAHSLTVDGYSILFNGKLITVFSASNYLGSQGNVGAVIELTQNGEMIPHSLKTRPYILRKYCNFVSELPPPKEILQYDDTELQQKKPRKVMSHPLITRQSLISLNKKK